MASYAGSAQAVTVNLGTNTASGGDAAGDTLTSIEDLCGSAHADRLTGDANTNVLEGGAGADVLDGGGGTDWAVYDNSAAGVQVHLGSPAAKEYGDAAGDTLTNIENLRGSRHADILVGDGHANELVGGGGMDSLAGENGNDVLRGEGDGDTLTGGAGTDTLYGGAGADHLSGNADADVLYGGSENDRLTGGVGADTLVGGTGADTFEFLRAGDSTVGARDVVMDFGAGDMLDLRQLGTDVRVRYQRVDKAGTEHDTTLVQVDVNKDGDMEAGEDFEVELKGLHELGTEDFMLTGDNAQVMEVTDIVVA